MTTMRIAAVTLAASALMAAAAAFGPTGIARAEHAHWLETPGTCVEDLGSGQTSIADPDHGGYHQFHVNVHLGTPGAEALANPNNPVSVGKNDRCPGA